MPVDMERQSEASERDHALMYRGLQNRQLAADGWQGVTDT